MRSQETLEAVEPGAAKSPVPRAAVVAAPGEIRLDGVRVPTPGRGEVRIKIEGCGVCASGVPVWEGREWFDYPLEAGEPGHEGWGRIDAVGDGVSGLQVGDRVAALSYHAFADYDIASADAVAKLPPELDGLPFPGEPIGCAINIFRRSEIEAGQTVAIIGIGFLGALLTRLASDAGARVIAITRRESGLSVARQMGAAEIIPLRDHWEIIEKVKSLTKDEGCERVIEATGKQWPLDLAAELTKIRGRLIIAGYHQDGARQVNMQLWNWRGLDVVNAHERDPAVYMQGIREAIDAVANGRLDPTPLYTHHFSLEEADAAFDMVRERPEGFMKALIYMDSTDAR